MLLCFGFVGASPISPVGLYRRELEPTFCLRTLVTFDEVKVPAENLLGREGQKASESSRAMVGYIARRNAVPSLLCWCGR